jgi:hypothetical protein
MVRLSDHLFIQVDGILDYCVWGMLMLDKPMR